MQHLTTANFAADLTHEEERHVSTFDPFARVYLIVMFSQFVYGWLDLPV